MSGGPDLGALFGAAAAETFLGLPPCPDLSRLDAPAAIFGAGGATPYASVGSYCRNAPAALRAATAAFAGGFDRYDFESGGPLFPDLSRLPADTGDLPLSETDFAANRAAIRERTAAILARGAVPVMLGGDDSTPIPMLEALGARTAALWILQIDAHIDWRDEHMGERLGLSSTMRRASGMAHVAGIVQVGARGMGSARSGDVAAARAWGARLVTAEALDGDGVAAALAPIPEGADIAICFDADALDPSIMPAVIGRAPGGLSYWQALGLMRGAAARGRIVAADFVEFMPERDVDGLGALTFARLVADALGLIAGQG
ncbi:MAG: arginase family protein [Pikeienuella sp.]|uniref:arginase family protein n=1 Tax=Pikeienuella sp. TaxID=2831957 RepID=UPI00391B125E